MAEGTTLSLGDFDLTHRYNMFEILYSTPKDPLNIEIKIWQIVGFVLETSSDERRFNYILVSYPISKFVSQNNWEKTRSLEWNSIISSSKSKIIDFNKEKVTSHLNDLMSELEQM